MDAIWEVKQDTNENVVSVWNKFEEEAKYKKENGEFDEIFLTQVHPGNFQNYDGTCRSSLFRGYPNPITVPITPIVVLTDTEVNNVKRFVSKYNLSDKDRVILFECDANSGQSFLTPEFALETVKIVLKKESSIKFILSSNKPIDGDGHNILDGSELSFRENAELTKYCELLIGCSSGISWLATSDWAKPLPKIQLLNAKTYMYASMIEDARYFGLPTDNILEMQSCTPDRLANCILDYLKDGFPYIREKYHQECKIKFDFYFQQIHYELLTKNEFLKAAQSINAAFERYSYSATGTEELRYIVNNIFSPYLNIFWNNINDADKNEICKILHYHPDSGNRIAIYLHSIAKILLSMYRSDDIAKRLLRDIILRGLVPKRVKQ